MIHYSIPGTPVEVAWSDRSDNDMATIAPGGEAHSLLAVVPARLAVLRLRQVHGADVAIDPEPGGSLIEADAIVLANSGGCPVILTADCMAVALGSPEGLVGAVHAGWRGLVAGVLERAVETMYREGSSRVIAAIGPHIGTCCYEFSSEDMEPAVERFGLSIASRTTGGAVSMDLSAGARQAVERAGAVLAFDSAQCTACSGSFYSYRAQRTTSRQAMFAWDAAEGVRTVAQGRRPPA